MTKFDINSNDAGQKIFNFIKKMFKDTKLSIIYKWFRVGKIKVNNKKTKDLSYILQQGDVVLVYDSASKPQEREWIKVNYDNLDIVYEDDNILIADKDHGTEIHTSFNVSLDNMVRSYLVDRKKKTDNSIENSFIVSHVHRLDKLTSGLVIYAKNKPALDYFLDKIQNKDCIEKIYVAKVTKVNVKPGTLSGHIEYDSEKAKALFLDKPNKFTKECSLEIIDIDENYLTIKLLTGRKHQIRATLEYFRSPIVNDFRYGGNRENQSYIGLNANRLTFHNLEGKFAYLNEKTFQSNKLDF